MQFDAGTWWLAVLLLGGLTGALGYMIKHSFDKIEKKLDTAVPKEDFDTKIKKFWGTTENAVRIQISVAIITYCLVAIVQHDMKLKRSTYEVLQILSISLTDKTHLRDLFDKTNFNDVKDLNDPLIPGLFD